MLVCRATIQIAKDLVGVALCRITTNKIKEGIIIIKDAAEVEETIEEVGSPKIIKEDKASCKAISKLQDLVEVVL